MLTKRRRHITELLCIFSLAKTNQEGSRISWAIAVRGVSCIIIFLTPYTTAFVLQLEITLLPLQRPRYSNPILFFSIHFKPEILTKQFYVSTVEYQTIQTW